MWYSRRRFKQDFDSILGTMGGVAGLSTCQTSAKITQNLFNVIWHFITLKVLSYGSLNGMKKHTLCKEEMENPAS